MEDFGRYYEGIGRRKRASARVRIYPANTGNGAFVVNGKDVKEYFPRLGDFEVLTGPLYDSELLSKMDVTVLVQGGGITGQTDAVRWVWLAPWSNMMKTSVLFCVKASTLAVTHGSRNARSPV